MKNRKPAISKLVASFDNELKAILIRRCQNLDTRSVARIIAFKICFKESRRIWKTARYFPKLRVSRSRNYKLVWPKKSPTLLRSCVPPSEWDRVKDLFRARKSNRASRSKKSLEMTRQCRSSYATLRALQFTDAYVVFRSLMVQYYYHRISWEQSAKSKEQRTHNALGWT